MIRRFRDRLKGDGLDDVAGEIKGVSRKAFDGSGNYTIGLKEHSIFPEINPNNMDKIRSLEVTIVTTAKTDSECFELLSGFGMPFMKEKEKE